VLENYRGRFHWELQANQGQAVTMNRGWRMSHGEILAYLSADDVLLPQAVRVSVDALQRRPDVVLSYCDFALIDPAGSVIRRVHTPEFDPRRLVAQMICYPGPGAFFRRRAYEASGDWQAGYRQYADFEFWLRLALQGPFERIPQVLAQFRVHPGSQSFTSVATTSAEEPIRVMDGFFASDRVPESLRTAKAEALSAAHLQSARLHWRAGNYRQGLARLRQALALYPPNLVAWRTLRLAFNALFNRAGHRLLWLLRGMRRKAG